MKAKALIIVTVAAAWVLAGCDENENRNLQVTTSSQNNIVMELAGDGDKLVAQKKLEAAGEITSADGVKIAYWSIDAHGKSKGTAVILHGLYESKANYMGMGKKLAADGYDVVLVDLRHHGDSGGKYITCGAKEKDDVKAIMDKLSAEGKIAQPFYVFGVNYGAVTGILYAEIDPRVKGVVAIGPWQDTVTKFKRDLGLFASPEDLNKALENAKEDAGFDPRGTSALESARHLTCPLYLIHGTADLIVPVSDSEAIFAVANKPKELKVVLAGSPEQIIIGMDYDGWLARQVEKVAKDQVGKKKVSAKNKAAKAVKKTPAKKQAVEVK
ncbi:MAG TPA: alpha/beta fold hydrolase [Phycisphaerae bacterium]|nr:alpha/beta fold hydrolase [Phycisphaerae bacterium]